MIETISIDPGPHLGWARYRDEILTEFDTLATKGEFFYWLTFQNPQVFVVEDYIIRPVKSGGFDHQWNKGETLRMIGAIEFQAHRVGAKFVLQQSSIKPAAYGQMGGKYKKGKANMHHMDAVAHGHYYLVKQGVIKLGVNLG